MVMSSRCFLNCCCGERDVYFVRPQQPTISLYSSRVFGSIFLCLKSPLGFGQAPPKRVLVKYSKQEAPRDSSQIWSKLVLVPELGGQNSCEISRV